MLNHISLLQHLHKCSVQIHEIKFYIFRQSIFNAINQDEGSYQQSHTYNHFLDTASSSRVKNWKNWVPASSDEGLKWGQNVNIGNNFGCVFDEFILLSAFQPNEYWKIYLVFTTWCVCIAWHMLLCSVFPSVHLSHAWIVSKQQNHRPTSTTQQTIHSSMWQMSYLF